MRKQKKIVFPYQIVTPILLLFLFFLPQLKSLYAWLQHLSWSMVPIVLISLTMLSLVFISLGLKVYYHIRAKKEWRVMQVIPSNQLRVTPKQVEAFVLDLYQRHRSFWQRFLRGREWFSFLIHTNDKNKVFFYFCYPQDKQTGVQRTIQSHFPACRLREIPHSKLPLPNDEQPFGGGYFAMNRRGKRAGLPLQSLGESQLSDILYHMAPQTWLWLQFSPNLTQWKLERRVKQGLKNLGLSKHELQQSHLENPTRNINELTPVERARYHSLYQQHTGREKSFQVVMSLWIQRQGQDVSVFVQDMKSTIERVMEGDNYVYLRKQWLLPKKKHTLFQPTPHLKHQMTWSHAELANLLHLPDGQEQIYQIQKSEKHRPTIQTHFFRRKSLPKASKWVCLLMIPQGKCTFLIDNGRIWLLAQELPVLGKVPSF